MGWIGVAQAKSRLAIMMTTVQKKAEAPIAKRAEEAVAQMKQDVAVDTGKLRDSIEAKKVGKGTQIEAKAEHAWFVEHGTFKMPAQPFFNPALERMKSNLAKDYKDFLKGLK